jgi:hypothetical protein
MNRSFLRRLRSPDSDDILANLTQRQHLQPHRALGPALTDAAEEVGFCPDAAAKAVQWLGLDPAVSIGRLRRTELTQLARCIYRFWRQSTPAHEHQSQPA